MSNRTRIEILSKRIVERNERLLTIKMQKKQDFINGIVRTYPEEQSLIRANLSDKIELKQWQDEQANNNNS